MLKKLHSVFTDDLSHCYLCRSNTVAIHHIFGASNRKRSEKYGFILPLHPRWHNMSNDGVHFNRELDLKFKRMAQEYYENHYGTRADFIIEFGKSYL